MEGELRNFIKCCIGFLIKCVGGFIFCNGVHVAFLLLSVMAAGVSSCDYNVIVCVCVLWCGCSSEKTDTVCDSVCGGFCLWRH